MFAATAMVTAPAAVSASGGATAGKTTSIPRAKVRYYGRISQVLFAYGAVEAAIKSGEAAQIKTAKKAFFSEADDSPSSELKSAGYLLAVAFKIDSKIPPDKIPAVKDYKSMMSGVESLKKAMGSGKADEAAKALTASRATVNAYLEAVELPPLGDPRYNAPDTACFYKCGE